MTTGGKDWNEITVFLLGWASFLKIFSWDLLGIIISSRGGNQSSVMWNHQPALTWGFPKIGVSHLSSYDPFYCRIFHEIIHPAIKVCFGSLIHHLGPPDTLISESDVSWRSWPKTTCGHPKVARNERKTSMALWVPATSTTVGLKNG